MRTLVLIFLLVIFEARAAGFTDPQNCGAAVFSDFIFIDAEPQRRDSVIGRVQGALTQPATEKALDAILDQNEQRFPTETAIFRHWLQRAKARTLTPDEWGCLAEAAADFWYVVQR